MNDVTLNKRPQKHYHQTRAAFMAALGLNCTDKKLFESIKDTLKDIMRDHMDWRKTYGGQTKETLELIKLKIIEKHPEWRGNSQALGAVITYYKRHYSNARWASLQHLSADRAESPALCINLDGERGVMDPTESTIAGGEVVIRPWAPARSLNNQRFFGNSNKAAHITYLPPQSLRLASTRSHVGGGSEALHRIPCDAENNSNHDLLDLPKSRNGSTDLLESGLDSKVFALAWHIAQLYSAGRNSASYKD